MRKRVEKKLSFSVITVEMVQLGEDWLLTLSGGEKPHIGCVVMAVPRPSLTGSGQVSATSSVVNLTGHKDEELCRLLAERTAKEKNAVTVCTGGFHMDRISREQIAEVMEAVREIGTELLKE